jgi:hypothetical protein
MNLQMEAFKETRDFTQERKDLLASKIKQLESTQKQTAWPSSVFHGADEQEAAPSAMIQSKHVTVPDLKKMLESKYGQFGTETLSDGESSDGGSVGDEDSSSGSSSRASDSDYGL